MESSYTTKSPVIKGAGLRRRKLNAHQRAEMAADVVTATRPFVPSREQAAREFNVSLPMLRHHLAARAKNGNGANGNGASGHAEHATTPAAPTPDDPNKFVRDHQLADLIAALDATIEILRDLREGEHQ